MEHLLAIMEENLNESFLRATISGKRRADLPDKIRIRPVEVKGALRFQTAISDGKREFHANYTAQELLARTERWLRDDYRQLQADTAGLQIQALVSKKGKATVRTRQVDTPCAVKIEGHNRKKNYILPEGVPVPFLQDLGVMTADGRVVNAHQKKFRQINRFMEFVEDVLDELPTDRELRIIDFGCGKSYLTFAMYYYLHERKGYRVQMTGLDLKEDVIAHCSAMAVKYGYEQLHFQTGDIASYEGTAQADMVVTLHACDTATDYALKKAVAWNAKVILSVPCCHHELNRQIRSDLMRPVLKYGLIRERMAALLTDAFRADLLEEQGYQVQILEFIDMEHTPKNILIRAVKKADAGRDKGHTELAQCMRAWNADPLLAGLLEEA